MSVGVAYTAVRAGITETCGVVVSVAVECRWQVLG